MGCFTGVRRNLGGHFSFQIAFSSSFLAFEAIDSSLCVSTFREFLFKSLFFAHQSPNIPACNVAYIGSVDCESLTGNECIRRAVAITVDDAQRGVTRPVSVHFKVRLCFYALEILLLWETER